VYGCEYDDVLGKHNKSCCGGTISVFFMLKEILLRIMWDKLAEVPLF
jgi:hypothetical protein